MISNKQPIETLVPGEDPIELVAYHDDLAHRDANCAMETKYWFVKNVRPDWVILDVGAGVGCLSVLFSRLAFEGHIYAFEPTSTAEMLAANLAHNGCGNVQIEQVALGSMTGAIEDSISQILGHEAERQVYPFYRLDDYVRNNNISKLDCIAIDVDSFGFEVLLGARETLHSLKPIIVVKLDHALSLRNQSTVKALEWLREQGVEEVLSLDGCTFVITPGHRPSATYPVQQAISIAFADARELPCPDDEKTTKITRSIVPHHAVVVHGDARVMVLPGGSAIEVVTAKPQWAYSAAFAMPTELEPDPNRRILIDMEVLNGQIGVGCLGKDGQYIGHERQISPGGRRTVVLPVRDVANLVEVMLRNGSAQGQRSTARIHGLKIGHLIQAPAVETRVSVQELARPVVAVANSEANSGLSDQPLSDGVVEFVGYEHLGTTLGFQETSPSLGGRSSFPATRFDILLTHSSRPVDLNQCSFEALNERYSDPDRLANLPPLSSLAPISAARAYEGGVSLLQLELSENGAVIKDKGFREIGRKIQHAAFVGDNIVLCLEDSLYVTPTIDGMPAEYPAEGDPNRIDDCWFAGLHTCFPIDEETCLASASAPDAFFWVSLSDRRVVRRVRVPAAIYGRNYDMDDTTSLQRHYVGNDQQLAHLNCAFPMLDGGVIYSTLIQGHLGLYHPTAGWQICRSGNIGCHGARVTDDQQTIYFADSPRGDLVMLHGTDKVERRFHRPSKWLHDVQQLPGTRYFLLAESDRNTLSLLDASTGKLAHEWSRPERGASIQFLHARRAAESAG